MSANGMSRIFTPVVQGKNQQSSMNDMQNHNTGNNTNVPVTGASYTGGSLRGNSANAPPPQQQGPSHSTFGIGGNSNF